MLHKSRLLIYTNCRRFSVQTPKSKWPPALPVTDTLGLGSSAFHESYGRAVNDAALHSVFSRSWLSTDTPSASRVLNMYLSEQTTRTLALALPLDHFTDSADLASRYYKLVGYIAEEQGLKEAVDWVKALYAPFVAHALSKKSGPSTPANALDWPVSASAQTAPQSEPALKDMQENVGKHNQSAQLGPIDLTSNEGMNLFDPESWLVESPTAKRLWKESK